MKLSIQSFFKLVRIFILAVGSLCLFSPSSTTTVYSFMPLSPYPQQKFETGSTIKLSSSLPLPCFSPLSVLKPNPIALSKTKVSYKKSGPSTDDEESRLLAPQEDDGSGSGSSGEIAAESTSFSYGTFAKENPFLNNVLIATMKTAAADLLAQIVIGQTPLAEVDLQRSLLFCAFGAIYLGGFQYLYQVQIFKKLFDVDKFTTQTWSEKLQDKEGLKALAAQTVLDLTVLTIIYLPTFYIFKASVFSGSTDPTVWTSTGLENYSKNFGKDEFDLLRVWLPADIVCFSVPLYLRLPARHIVR